MGATAEPPPSSQSECGASVTPEPIKFVTNPQYHNPDAAIRLIGRANGTEVFIDNIKVTALIDTGAQVSTITQDFYKEHGYKIHPVKQMLHLEGTQQFTIRFLGYVETTFKIPQIKDYDQCVSMLVLKSSPYSSWVPVQISTTILN